MKLITRFDTASRTTSELYALKHEALLAFTSAARGSEVRGNALASLDAIEAELVCRSPHA